jgi:hypothetical protein
MRRVLPAAGSDGYIQAVDGQWKLTDVPTATIPDPLQIADLTVTSAATIVDLLVSGSFCFPSVALGTIATVVGLDSNGCLVKQSGTGSILNLGLAMYYENPDETSTAVPNNTIANSGYAVIGNELFDNNSIAQVVDTQTVRVNQAGKYLVLWSWSWGIPPTNRTVNLSLEINGAGTPIPGTGPTRIKSGGGTDNQFQGQSGMTIRQFAANDVLKLKCVSDVATNNPLQKVKLIIVNFAS